MAAGGGAGVVTVWDLEQRRLHTLIRDAHDAPLVSLHFFPGEPLLMSSARDNSLKHWVFDAADGAARLLRFRSGHAAPPAVVRHYGAGRLLLSAGQDRAFRAFSTIQDAQSRELSQHHTKRRAKKLKIEEAELKLTPVLALDTCDVSAMRLQCLPARLPARPGPGCLPARLRLPARIPTHPPDLARSLPAPARFTSPPCL